MRRPSATLQKRLDYDKLKRLSSQFGYWSHEVLEFNEELKDQFGYPYMEQLNNKLKAEKKIIT